MRLVDMTGKQDIAVIHRYFWPQNYPYATMLKDIVESLVGDDARITVYSTITDKNAGKLRYKWASGLSIAVKSTRLSTERKASIFKKIINSVRFGVWLFFSLVFSHHDKVLVATTPPVIIAFLVTVLSKIKGFKVIYHCQDIHPESLRINGSVKSSLVYRLLLMLDRFTVKNAWKVIVLSKDMKQTILSRGDSRKVDVINNFVFHELAKNECIEANKSTKIRFIFAGTLGHFQNLEILINGLKPFRDREDLEFIFLGDGPLKTKISTIAESINLNNVKFLPSVPVDKALQHMFCSDVGIVSLSKGVAKVAFPSKSIMYMSTGLPIFAVIDKDSELSQILDTFQMGVSVEAEKGQIEQGILEIIQNVKQKVYTSSEIRTFARENYGKQIILSKLRECILDYG